METAGAAPGRGWAGAVKPYLEKESLAAFFLGVSSGFPYALIGATLTSRLAQDGIDKKTVTAFTLVFLAYNLKFLWAWVIDGVRLPIIGALGQRVSWMLFVGALVIAAVANLALVDPASDIGWVATSAILVGIAGATFDIIIDAYRIETLRPDQLGVGSGMTQYGWRIGSAGAGALALIIAARAGWEAAYIVCAAFALPAMLTALVLGEPARRRVAERSKSIAEALRAVYGPFTEFFLRKGAVLVLLFILLHKIGDTLANLTVRLLLDDKGYTNDEIALYDVGVGFWAFLIGIFIGDTLANLTVRLLLDDKGYTNDEIALYDVGVGFWAFLIGIFIGGILYTRLGMKRAVLLSLVLMGVSNFSFALLAAVDKTNAGLAATFLFENVASGIGGVTVVAYFAALTDLRFTASQYALISAAASIVGRVLTGTTAGALVESFGYVNFYLFTTAAAVPGIVLFWLMMRAGLIDASIGTAGTESGEGG